MNQSHPLVGLLDATAAGGKPPSADIDEVVADLVGRFDDPAMSPATLRRRIKEVVDRIVEARDEGNSGQARALAREHSRLLADELGEYRPPSKSEGKTIEEIVAAIPRGGF